MRQVAVSMLDGLGSIPPLRPALKLAHAYYFNRATGQRRSFRGVYPDFAAATRDIPHYRASSYDDEAAAPGLINEAEMVFSSDYAMMFWFLKNEHDISAVFDWGGYLGRGFRVYRRLVGFPDHLKWVINDVPAVVELGRSHATPVEAAQLSFTTAFDALQSSDLLLASGSLHFIEDPWDKLRQAPRLPRHLLIDKAPVYQMESATTLHNFGPAVVPNHLFNRAEFIQKFVSLGYELIDNWQNHNVNCLIPFHPKHSILAYSGFYFRRPE